MTPATLKDICEHAYTTYHRADFIRPDPLELLMDYEDVRDREIAGFIAAALALGRAGSIVNAGRTLLARIGAPYAALTTATDAELQLVARGFRYRFFDESQIASLLCAMKRVIAQFGSLESCFASGLAGEPGTSAAGTSVSTANSPEQAVAGLTTLADTVIRAAPSLAGSILVARPERGSACKRLFLYLRWMVRRDAVDPGGWTVIAPRELLVPVDTHMLAVCRSLGLTQAKHPSIAVSREVTAWFRLVVPDDPVRYDFSLTRLGIHPDGRASEWGRSISGENQTVLTHRAGAGNHGARGFPPADKLP